jgi:molybdate transport system substrate-binding protein
MRLKFKTAVLVLALLISPSLRAADLKVLSAGAYQEVLMGLLPEFEKQTGNHVVVEVATAGALAKQIQDGAKFDVVLASDAVIDTLGGAGKIARDSRTQLARVGIGVCVKAGAPAPDISTVESFKRALLAAKTVGYVDPASGGTSGIYLEQLFVKLGIADQIRPKAKKKQGGRVADLVISGEAELGIQQISELASIKGVTLLGGLPPEIQAYTVYAGGASSQSSNPAAARSLLNWLSGPKSAPVLKQNGMTQPN